MIAIRILQRIFLTPVSFPASGAADYIRRNLFCISLNSRQDTSMHQKNRRSRPRIANVTFYFD